MWSGPVFCGIILPGVAVFGFSIPVFGVLFSGIFLGERFLSWKNLAALFLICAGIVIVNLRKKEEKADG